MRMLLFIVGALTATIALSFAVATRSGEGEVRSPQARARPSIDPSTPSPAEACSGESAIEADVDGDGRADRVYEVFHGGRRWVGACTASGETDQVEYGANDSLFGATDVEPDGRDEVFAGGTTAYSAIVDLLTWRDGRLREAVGDDGNPLTLTSGILRRKSWAWGCEDAVDGGAREVVQVEASWSREGGRWSKTVYRIDGVRAHVATTLSGTFPPTPRSDRSEAVTELTGDYECRGDR